MTALDDKFKKNNSLETDFKNFYISYFSQMKRFAKEYVVSEDDAEDIVQEIFLELWERKEIFPTLTNWKAFMLTTVKNKCIDFLRHKIIEQKAAEIIKGEYTRTLQMKFESLEAFDEELGRESDIESVVTKAIQSLPDKCREIFIKSKIEGKKQKAIAEELGVSINTVESQIGIAYKKLKIILKEYLPIIFFMFF